MNRPSRRYEAEPVRRFSEMTIAYYDRFARAFWEGTRHPDVRQNYAAFLNAIESDPPYSILDLGCRPARPACRERGNLGSRPFGARHSARSCDMPLALLLLQDIGV